MNDKQSVDKIGENLAQASELLTRAQWDLRDVAAHLSKVPAPSPQEAAEDLTGFTLTDRPKGAPRTLARSRWHLGRSITELIKARSVESAAKALPDKSWELAERLGTKALEMLEALDDLYKRSGG